MACFTISVGFLKIGETFLSNAACVEIAQALWIVGVTGALFSAFVVPYLMFTRHELTPDKTAGSWLLPIVPPIVASVPAALLATTWPLALQTDMLVFAYALLGIGVILAAIVIVLFYSRLVYQKIPAAPLVPTMWIVIGPLGQSIAGIVALGTAARTVWPTLGGGLAITGTCLRRSGLGICDVLARDGPRRDAAGSIPTFAVHARLVGIHLTVRRAHLGNGRALHRHARADLCRLLGATFGAARNDVVHRRRENARRHTPRGRCRPR
jgi:hypothetical protein